MYRGYSGLKYRSTGIANLLFGPSPLQQVGREKKKALIPFELAIQGFKMLGTRTLFIDLGSITATWRALLALLLCNLFGCANTPEDGATVQPLSSEECETFSSLLIDPEFQTWRDAESAWRYEQHTGAQSFKVSQQNGELSLSRIGTEPWMLYIQKVTDSRLSGRIVRYSAEVKGDVALETTHGFPSKAGLFLRIGPRPDAVMADHEPNVGEWGWQRITVERAVPEIFDYIEVGFIYQAGEGTLMVRAPRISLAECSD